MALSVDPAEFFADPPEHLQTDSPEDEAVYAVVREHFGSRLNGLEDDVLPRFVRGYATEEKRLQVTLERIEHYLEMRQQNNFDHLLDTPWDEYEACATAWKFYLYGQNKYGHPVVYDGVGSSDLPLLRSILPPKDVEKLFHFRFRCQLMIQRYKKAIRIKHGKMLYQQVFVYDLSGFTASHFSGKDIRGSVAAVLREFQHLFPETTHKVYVINAPLVFRAAWKVISCFLDPLTYKKTKVLGPGFLSEMTKEIDISQIPRKFGGTGKWPIRYGWPQTDDMEEILGNLESEVPPPVVDSEIKDAEDDLDGEKNEPSLSFNPEPSQSESRHSVENRPQMDT